MLLGSLIFLGFVLVIKAIFGGSSASNYSSTVYDDYGDTRGLVSPSTGMIVPDQF